jgi:CHAT domain-containing protein
MAALRCALDTSLWDDKDASLWCRDKLQTVPLRDEYGNVRLETLPFDLAAAHELYKVLIGPVEDMIKGKRLLIVPSGPLTSLPFNVLVTESPKTAIPETLVQYRDVTWLGMRAAITVLPSVSSLKALRQYAKIGHATKRYLGIGDPLLDGEPDNAEDAKRAQAARDKQQCPKSLSQRDVVAAARPLASFVTLFRGAQADIEDVRSQAPLPETADELCEVARRLGVPESDILLGADATEARLKDLSNQGRLANYAIVHFATHGALNGQVQGLAEPGLILTPPPKGTSDPKDLEREDG